MQNLVSYLADGLFRAIGESSESAPAMLPSFVYDGMPFSEKVWERSTIILEDAEAFKKFQVAFTSPDRRLKLRLIYTVYSDYPVVEWVPFLDAIGEHDTKIVENFRSLNIEIPLESKGNWMTYSRQKIKVRRNLGSKNRRDDFVAQDVWMTDRYPLSNIVMDTDEGRSSAAWLPFFGVDFDENYGFNAAIGWSGQWSANFELNWNSFKVNAGMGHTHFRLHPGESIRQPSIFVMLRDGITVTEMTNLHRRFMLDFHSPHDKNGALLSPQFAAAVWGGQTNDTVIRYLDQIAKNDLKYNMLWMDAGWFGNDRPVATDEFQGSDWAETVGNWRVNQVPHPGGLMPIAKRAHDCGMKFMLWVEMERVMKDSPIVAEHPDWVLDNPNEQSDSLMLNLGNPGARQWAFNTVRNLVENEGVDYYREDFNFNTIPYWHAADAVDRQGITEAKFIEGFYEFWDNLRNAFPDMMIDNCASGGRRMDFETASRSICMFRSDLIGRYFFDSSTEQLTQLHYLAQWLPIFGGSVFLRQNETYQALACSSYGISFGCGYDPSAQNPEWEKKVTDCMKKMQEYMADELYLLTEHPEDCNDWIAYQFHSPEKNAGFFAAFRIPEAPQKKIELHLAEISPRAAYLITDGITGKTSELKGRELASFIVEGAPMSAHVFFYSRKTKAK